MTLTFGAQVLVHALTMRVVGYHDGDTARFKIPQANDVPWFDATADEWPGDPVKLEWDLPKGPRFDLEPSPNGHAIVRYRRLTLDPPHLGIVVGSCWRWEGVLEETTLAGPKRSLSVYQVALQPPPRSAKALIVFVHPRDAAPVPTERGVTPPARSRVGTGRLGGG